VRPDALTPALSHRERENTLMPSSRPSPTGEGEHPDALTPALSHRERENTLMHLLLVGEREGVEGKTVRFPLPVGEG